MGLIKAFDGAIAGAFADQWRDIITVEPFGETEAVKPGIRLTRNRKRGSNTEASEGVISHGSKIYVPENTFAVVFDNSGIEGLITEPGGYEYHKGEKSVLSGDSVLESFINAFDKRFDFGGQPSDYKHVIFINLRELRNIKFGTHGPVLYHDIFYDVDLEVISHGTFTIQITKPVTFIQNYLPANTENYDFSDKHVTEQIQSEFIQSFVVALNRLSKTHRASELPGLSKEISEGLKKDDLEITSWEERFGFQLISASIQSIEFTEDARKLVQQYSSNRMNVAAYSNVSKSAADIAFQQSLGSGVKEHGLGDGAGVIMGMNMVNGVMSQNGNQPVNSEKKLSIDEQIETVKKLKELVDIGALSEEEFEKKKEEIMGV